jgi:hypothetical protein
MFVAPRYISLLRSEKVLNGSVTINMALLMEQGTMQAKQREPFVPWRV